MHNHNYASQIQKWQHLIALFTLQETWKDIESKAAASPDPSPSQKEPMSTSTETAQPMDEDDANTIPATLEVVMINSLSSESSELFSYSCMVLILYASMLMLPTQVTQHYNSSAILYCRNSQLK